jgi:hypothetical protein
MCIYCGTNKYRKIYESHFSPIPKDEEGRSYEIHHLDGNRNNNSLDNLKCVSIQEHYDIHYSQGDWAACLIMSDRMKICPKEKSKISKMLAEKQIELGKHVFMKREDGTSLASDKVANGTSYFLTEEHKRNQKIEQEAKLAMGIHPFQEKDSLRKLYKNSIEQGTHPTCQIWTCNNCGKTGKGKSNYSRWHGDNCGKHVKYSEKGKEKYKRTMKEKYQRGYLNPNTKIYKITNIDTGFSECVLSLSAWIKENEFVNSTVRWHVSTHGRYKNFMISVYHP